MESITTCAAVHLFAQNEAVLVDKLRSTSQFLHGIFKNEFSLLKGESFDAKAFLAHLKTANKLNMIKLDLEQGIVTKSKDLHSRYKIHFVKNLLQSYIDSYLIVAQSILKIMDLRIIIEQKKLVQQLQNAIQVLYNKGHVRFINSFLPEIIETAICRFSELEFCTLEILDAYIGEKIIDVSCYKTAQQKPTLMKYI